MAKKNRLKNGNYGCMSAMECKRHLFKMLYITSPFLKSEFSDRVMVGTSRYLSEQNGEGYEDKKAIYINGKVITGFRNVAYLSGRTGCLIALQDDKDEHSLLVDEYCNVICAAECDIETMLKRMLSREVLNNKEAFKREDKRVYTDNLELECKHVNSGRYKIICLKYEVRGIFVKYYLIEFLHCILDMETGTLVLGRVFNDINDLSQSSVCQIWKGLHECAWTFVDGDDIEPKVGSAVIDLNNDGKEVGVVCDDPVVGNCTDVQYTFLDDGYYVYCEKDNKSWVAKFNTRDRVFEQVTPVGDSVDVEEICGRPKHTSVVKVYRRGYRGIGRTTIAKLLLKNGNQVGKVRTKNKTRKQLLREKDCLTVC